MDEKAGLQRKRLRKKKILHEDEAHAHAHGSGSGIQSTATTIIFFIFTIYFWGFISCVQLLPDVKSGRSVLEDYNTKVASSAKRHRPIPKRPGLNIAVDTPTDAQDDDDDTDPDPADDGHADDGPVDDQDIKEEEAMKAAAAQAQFNSRQRIRKPNGHDGDESPMDDQKVKDERNKEEEAELAARLEEHKRIHDPFAAGGKKNDANINASANKKTNTDTPIPKATWPVTSTSKQQDQWLSYPHPGDGAMTVTMPSFWSPPVHDQKLMSRKKALQIGTCIVPDGDNYQRGDACPVNDRTIFVAIASYRDWQCKHTVTSIFHRAKYPERVRVAVVDQIVDGDDVCNEPIEETCETKPDQVICKFADQIDVYTMDAPLAIGPVFARHIGHRMYRGEYYAMQSDAHVTFTQDWDVDIIEQMEATGNEMTVLTTYLTDIVGSINEKNGKSLRRTRPIMCNTDYEGGPQGKHLRHMSQPERMPPSDLTMPQLQPWWAAGFSFNRGHFVVNVPYDQYQPMIFQGEEMSIGIRGFTIGYDYYAPQRSVCFHHYASMNKDREKVPHFWENSAEYRGTGIKAMSRLLGIVHMNPEKDPKEWSHQEEDIYGIGNVPGRTPEKFYETFGIDVVKKKTQPNLCNFVEGGRMHRQFMTKMRSDGMGIDYSKIKFKYKNRL